MLLPKTDSSVAYDATYQLEPLTGLEPATCSLGRSCSSIELQRRARRFYRRAAGRDGPSTPSTPYTRRTVAVPGGAPRRSRMASALRELLRGAHDVGGEAALGDRGRAAVHREHDARDPLGEV